MMAGTLTDWESSAGYKDSFAATVSQLLDAIEIYKILEERLVDYLTEATESNDPSQINL